MIVLNDQSITDEVVRRRDNCPDARLWEIMVAHQCDGLRQEFILLSDTRGLSQPEVAREHNRPAGAAETLPLAPA